MEFNNDNGILNGKAQIVEMLTNYGSWIKRKLLRNIRMRNPSLANELTEQSLTFDDLDKLDDAEIINLFSYLKAPIIGVALQKM